MSDSFATPWTSQVALVVENLLANAGDVRDVGLIPGLGRSPGGWHSNPLQYSCLENPMGRGAWQATVHRVTKSWTQLKQLDMHACFHILAIMNNTAIDIWVRVSVWTCFHFFWEPT